MDNNDFSENLIKEISRINLTKEQIKMLNKLNIFEKVEPVTITLIDNNMKTLLGKKEPELPTSCPYCDNSFINSNGYEDKIEIPSKDKKSMMIIRTYNFVCLKCKMGTPIWMSKETVDAKN